MVYYSLYSHSSLFYILIVSAGVNIPHKKNMIAVYCPETRLLKNIVEFLEN